MTARRHRIGRRQTSIGASLRNVYGLFTAASVPGIEIASDSPAAGLNSMT